MAASASRGASTPQVGGPRRRRGIVTRYEESHLSSDGSEPRGAPTVGGAGRPPFVASRVTPAGRRRTGPRAFAPARTGDPPQYWGEARAGVLRPCRASSPARTRQLTR